MSSNYGNPGYRPDILAPCQRRLPSQYLNIGVCGLSLKTPSHPPILTTTVHRYHTSETPPPPVHPLHLSLIFHPCLSEIFITPPPPQQQHNIDTPPLPTNTPPALPLHPPPSAYHPCLSESIDENQSLTVRNVKCAAHDWTSL